VRRVAGAQSPSRLSEHVKVIGWHPIDAKVKVTDVGRVIDLFGGDKLYGHSVLIPLRELIQNAADAVRLRRALDDGDIAYKGQITIRIRRNEDGQFLEVDDDGIGMSQDVLTGPLIDFTSSYLTSTIAKREYPGLVGKRTRRSGRYGVGFFSTFMLSDNVSVTSRPFDKSPDDARTLKFEGGLAVRPLLIDEKPKGYSAITSTRITVPITDEQIQNMKVIRKNHVSGEATYAPLERVIANLAPLVDVDIYLDNLGQTNQVHTANWPQTESLDWLKKIDLEEIEDDDYLAMLNKISEAVDFIDPDRPFLGRAVIAPMAGNGNYTVDGLNTPRMMGQAHNEFCGVIDRPSSGPRRQPNKWIDKTALGNWANRQAEKLAGCQLDNVQKYNAACRIANFGGDAFPIATICLNGDWVDIDTVYAKLKTGPLYAPIDPVNSRDGSWVLSQIRIKRRHVSYGVSRDNFDQNAEVIEAPSNSRNQRYLSVPEEEKRDSLSFLSLLTRLAEEDGLEIMTEGIQDFCIAKYTGEESKLENIENGMDMIMPVLKITLSEPAVG